MPEPIDRYMKEKELADILWNIWLEWSDVGDPSELSEDALRQMLRERGVEVLDSTWRGGYRAVLEQFEARERERQAAIVFLLFLDDWSGSLSSRWMSRVQQFQEDQQSESPYRPAWRHVRGAGERVVYRESSAPDGAEYIVGERIMVPREPSVVDVSRDEPDTRARGYWVDSTRDPDDGRRVIGAKPLVYPSDVDSEAISTITAVNTHGEFYGADEVGRQKGDRLIPFWYAEWDACEVCRPLDGKPPREWRKVAPYGPPQHPRCRCHLRYRYRFENRAS